MIRIITIGLTVAFLSGCATLDSRPPEDIVAERALQRLEALMARDVGASYALTTPGYRSLETQGEYGARWAGARYWTEVSVAKVDCNAEACNVAVSITFDQPRVPELTTYMQESWVQLRGKWYFSQPTTG
jgi:hypothetical protein